MKHPCTKGAGGGPCDNVTKGQAFTQGECPLCWNFWHKEHWNREWGGDGKVLAFAPRPQPVAPPRVDRPPERPPCAHLGEPTGARELCPTCAGTVEIKLMDCAVHGTCTTHKQLPGIACCAGCPDRQAPPVPDLVPGLPDPLPDWPLAPTPAGWAHRPEVTDKHIQALWQLLRTPITPPARAEGEGILLVGGGKYWKMNAVSARMARDVTDLPIQMWHNGRAEPVNPADVADLPDVTLYDLTDLRPRPRVLAGWENKLTALLHCGWRRCWFNDADAYLLADPRPLLDLAGAHRFVYWIDLPGTANNVKWHRFGLPRDVGQAVPQIQGGQLALDLVAFRRELVLAHWLCQHSEYSFAHGFSEQDQWRVVLAATGGTYLDLGECPWVHPGFVCSNEDRPMAVHRCQGKMHGDASDKRTTHLPGDERAWAYLAALTRASSRASAI